MRNGVTAALAFLIGGGVGSVVTYFALKKKHDKILNEEIESLREHYCKKKKPEQIVEEAAEEVLKKNPRRHFTKDEIAEYDNRVSELGYSSEENGAFPEGGSEPYVINPVEYGEIEGYEPLSWVYYADGYLADENDNLVEDFEHSVGADFAQHFGEYEDDSVYIRNDAMKCDYEILRSERLYREILNEKPYLIKKEE